MFIIVMKLQTFRKVAKCGKSLQIVTYRQAPDKLEFEPTVRVFTPTTVLQTLFTALSNSNGLISLQPV